MPLILPSLDKKEPWTTIHYIHAYVAPISAEMIEKTQVAMRGYAQEKARHFAGWIANQVIAGRTYDKLWNDYLTEHPLE